MTTFPSDDKSTGIICKHRDDISVRCIECDYLRRHRKHPDVDVRHPTKAVTSQRLTRGVWP